MIIQLKEKHLCYALHLIQTEQIFSYLDTALPVIDAIKANEGGENAVLSVDVPVDKILDVYRRAGLLPEVFSQSINQAIKAELMPQLIAYAEADNEDAIWLIGKITELITSAQAQLAQNINEARNRVLPQD